MQYLVVGCLALSAGQSPYPEYTGPAYAEYHGPARSVADRLKGRAMVWCVRVGLGPDGVRRLFGPPLLSDRMNKGPYQWWYPDLGVTVSFPARLFDPGPMGYERLKGSIGP